MSGIEKLEESRKAMRELLDQMSSDSKLMSEIDEESKKLSKFDSQDLLKPFTV